MSGTVALRASGLVKRFGAVTAVDGVSFEVAGGECFGVLGPNGAGKTTTMRMITGHLPPTAGTLTVLGVDAVRDPREVKRRVGVVPQEDNLDPDLSVRANLLVYAGYHAIPRREAAARSDELLSFMQLGDHAADRIDQLSGGMKRRLMVARALLNRPELLLLDEPTTGLDPQARHLIWQKLRSLRAQGVTQLLTTHYLEEAEQLCHRLVIMDHGKVLVEGPPAELIARHAGHEVLEVRLRPDEPAAECLGEMAGEGMEGLTVETAGDTLFLYSIAGEGSGEGGRSSLLERVKVCPERTVVHRRATLEDVFLRLTGRDLRE